MKRSWFPITLVVLLLGLLALLATLQYRWLGQISDGEHARLQSRLRTDTRRFAEDFNREIQNAYFNFQLDGRIWLDKNWGEFNRRLEFWRVKTAYPNLIKDFYFVELGGENLLRYDNQSKTFQAADWTTGNLINLKPKIADEKNFQPIAEEIPALLMPVHFTEDKISRVINVRTAKLEQENIAAVMTPERYGVLIIELDAGVLVKQLLPDTAKKYFGDGGGGADYKFAVTGAENRVVFQTEDLTQTDASVKFFNLAPDNLISYVNRDLLSAIDGEKKSVVFSRIERTTRQSVTDEKANRVEVRVSKDEEKPRVRIFDGENLPNEGVWTLNVQHNAGSLEQFISNARRKNLAVSFGILSLLAVSVCLILLSAQRARRFAQKQVDFVSAVSHEFRTPLAVIRSAGENLTDGVVNNRNQIAQYGALVKREGVKLSQMVEQILEFAGASSGKRKYDFRETNVEKIIENALAECAPLIKEKSFTVEKEIAENLPPTAADENALSQAIQNLIANAVKYSDGNSWLKISATNGGGRIKIHVEDRGIGIAPKDLKHIFEPFYRAKSVVDEQIHGNGLGLSLVEQTVKAHGGRVEIESEIGKGSRFTIELKSGKAEE